MLYINMLLIYLPYIIYLFICCINPHHKQIIALSLPPLYTAQNTLVSLTLVHQMCGRIRWKGGLRPINTAAWVSGEPVLKLCCTTWGSQPEPLWIHSCERCFIIAVRCFFYGKKRPQRNILSSSLQVRINRVHALLTCRFPVRKMPRSVRPGADDCLENVRCLSRFHHAPLLWVGAEQEWHLGDKIWMKECPLELRHASRSEIIGVINIPVPAEPLQLLQPG